MLYPPTLTKMVSAWPGENLYRYINVVNMESESGMFENNVLKPLKVRYYQKGLIIYNVHY